MKLPDEQKIEIDIADVTPIKITGELLANCCNFDETGNHIIGIDSHRHFLKIEENRHISLLNRQYEPMIHFWDVQHLHQLQNLYYALKNEEMVVRF